jgi:hypothetical protein
MRKKTDPSEKSPKTKVVSPETRKIRPSDGARKPSDPSKTRAQSAARKADVIRPVDGLVKGEVKTTVQAKEAPKSKTAILQDRKTRSPDNVQPQSIDGKPKDFVVVTKADAARTADMLVRDEPRKKAVQAQKSVKSKVTGAKDRKSGALGDAQARMVKPQAPLAAAKVKNDRPADILAKNDSKKKANRSEKSLKASPKDREAGTNDKAKISAESKSKELLAAMQAEYVRVTDALAKSEAELLRIAKLWREDELKVEQLSKNLAGLQAEKNKLHEDYALLGEEFLNLQEKVRDRYKEIASMTKMLKFSEHEIERKDELHQWMRDLVIKLLKMPKGWRFLTEKQFSERIHRRLEKSGLFHAKYYLELYPDVDAIGMDPLQHYILHGINENRLKNPQ